MDKKQFFSIPKLSLTLESRLMNVTYSKYNENCEIRSVGGQKVATREF